MAPRTPGVSGKYQRVTVNLTERSAQAIHDARAITGSNVTDTINRALLLYAFIEKHGAAGSTLLLRRPNGDVAEVTIL